MLSSQLCSFGDPISRVVKLLKTLKVLWSEQAFPWTCTCYQRLAGCWYSGVLQVFYIDTPK